MRTSLMVRLERLEERVGINSPYDTAPGLPGLDRECIRDWYNGYWWLDKEKVYNPYDVLLLFRRRKFDA